MIEFVFRMNADEGLYDYGDFCVCIYIKYPIEHPICQRFFWAKYKRCLKRINGMKNMKTPQHLRLKPAGTHQQWAFCSICTYYVYVQFIRMQILCNSIETQHCNMSTNPSLHLPSLHHPSNYCVGSPVGLDCESSHANEEQLGSPGHLEGITGGCR